MPTDRTVHPPSSLFNRIANELSDAEDILQAIHHQKHPRPQRKTAFVPPRTPTEKKLAQIWAEFLGLERVGIYDDFFYLGGHSILATQILSRVYDVFHIEIPVRAMFTGTFSVAELAKLVEEYQIERAEPDKIAALTLARLHAAGLLPSVWVPPLTVRDQRALVAQRVKMVRLATQATPALAGSARESRLHAVLHRHHLLPPEGDLFAPQQQDWWCQLPVPPTEQARIQCDLATLLFAQSQSAQLEQTLTQLAAQDERVPLLIQLPGVALITATTLLAAIGDIARFPTAEQLVGYAGLGSRVHDSGLTHRSGRITKSGRRDIRATMIKAAHTASRTHPHWKAELARLEPRLGYNKAIVAIARKLLVAVWHILSEECADRFAVPERVARKLLHFAYALGHAHRPQGQTPPQFVRQQLDRLGLGMHLTAVAWGKRRAIPLPPSRPSTSGAAE
jgi:transposase